MSKLLNEISDAVLFEIKDADKYLVMQINALEYETDSLSELYYNISPSCPLVEADRIVSIILKKAEELNIPIVSSQLPE